MSFAAQHGRRRFDALRPLLRFLRRKVWVILLWPALGLLLGMAGWAYMLADLEDFRRQTEADAKERVQAYAMTYASRTVRAIGDVDRLLHLLRHHWAISGGRASLAGTYEAGIFAPGVVNGAAIIGANGAVLSSSHAAAKSIDFSGQPYFVAQQRSQADRLYISAPMQGPLTHAEVIVFSRKLLSPAGRFGGIVVVSVFPAFFTLTYTEALLGEHGFLALAGSDGAIRTTRSGSTTHSTRSPLLRPPVWEQQGHGVALRDGRTWFADGRDRFVAWRPMPSYDMTALVGLEAREAMAPYWRERDDALARAWWNTCWLALATLLATSFHIVASWKKHQIDAIRAAYRLATEDAGDGFFINRPLYDKHGRVEDFEIIDCNQHGAELFGLRRQDLLGKRLTSLYQGEMAVRSRERLCEALEKGVYDGEIEVPPNDVLKAAWLHYKAIRADGDLAVTLRDISESKAQLQELERRSNEDELTRLPNRYWIQQYLPRAIAQAREGARALALLFIDLDGFKTVNDALGHAAGDELLRTVGKRLKIAVRPRDHVVRLGGDEFVVLLENVTRPGDVEHVAGRILDAFGDGFHLQHSTHVLSASIGISMFPEHGEDAQTLLKNADIAMYSVKTEGKGGYRFFQSRFYEAIRTRLETEMELRRAIELGQFVVHYQPRVDLAAGTASSMEALVRWERPGKGLTGPDAFIPLAEETGLIVALGELVIDSVCRQLRLWSNDGQVLVPVSVNVSPRQFSQSDILDSFRRAAARHSIAPSMLEIEVTESSMMQEGIGESLVFRQLRDLGIKLCIDDFGTGYSSLSQLQKLRFDVLKIDRAFVLRIEHPDGNTLLASMIAMAHALGMKVVAEGVENRRQMTMLQALGCDEGQGFFFSRPLAPGARPPLAASEFLPAIVPK
jgi:diguanylate cyclase (GGDEF)-like protein